MKCSCENKCGWTIPHSVEIGRCERCGIILDERGREKLIIFYCKVHGEIQWVRKGEIHSDVSSVA